MNREKEYIIVEVFEDGEIKAETFNYQGQSCSDNLNRLMKEIAMMRVDEKKPEYFKEKTGASNIVKVIK